MYLLAHATTTIQRPRAAVFDYVADLENFAAWFPGVEGVVATNDLPVAAAGKAYEETVVTMRRRRTVPIEVVESDAPSWLATEGALPVLLPRMEIGIADAGPDACTVDWRMVSRNPSVLARHTVLGLARRVMSRRAESGLDRLRRRLEGQDR